MRELFKATERCLSEGRDAVLVTVVASDGAVPRGAGARMLVTEKGREHGTIGGGAVEHRSEALAARTLEEKGAFTEKFRLYPNEVADLGMVCGGNVDVCFQYVPAGDEETLALLRQIEALFAAGEQFWLITETESGKMGIYGAKSGAFGMELPEEVIAGLGTKPKQLALGGKNYYCELLLRPGRVYIFGGGHVAQALVPALAKIGFRCVILEDRPEFARRELFPGVDETRLVDMNDLTQLAGEIGAADYICIMTRGHQSDFDVQKQLMHTGARYIGVIGSERKQRTVKEKLLELGFDEADFENVVSPIGLKIGAQTPEEIAVSIAAQLIQVRAGL